MKRVALRGAGGGGGGSDQPVRTADDLFSIDYVELVLGISEGPIRGLVDEAKSFYAGDTPLVSVNNVENFTDFSVAIYPGDPAPLPVINTLGGETSSLAVNVQLSQNIAVTRQTPSTARGKINVLEFRLKFATLYRQDDKGTYRHTARFQISYKAASSPTWINYQGQGETVVHGKTSAGYAKEFSIPVAALTNDDYDVRVTKFNVDSHTQEFVVIVWESLQMTTSGNRSYPNLALAHIIGRATSQFSSVPDFSGIYDGLVVKVPTNYNADAHTYDFSSAWNGTFKESWTSNPAWVLYDLITNPRYGLMKYYPHITVNRYDFYDAAVWCDESVPNGVGGYQPRYTYNDVLQDTRPGLELLQYVAGSFNSTVFDDANGAIHLRVDKWIEPTILFNPETVSPAGFSYSFTDITTRVNDITVSFINPELEWNEDRRRIFDQAKINTNGRIPLDFVAVGCTDVHEAQRRAQYRLLTANTELCSVNFETNRLGIMVEPFSTIWIADPTSGWSSGGRIKSIVGNLITLRDPIYVTALNSLTLKLQSVNTIVNLTVSAASTGELYEFTITAGTVPLNLPPFAAFTIEEAGFLGLAKPFRVLNVNEVEGSPNQFQISAIEINRNKYSDADNLTSTGTQAYTYRKPGMPLPPLGVIVESGTKHLARSQDGTIMSRIYIAWERPARAYVDHYIVEWQVVDSGQWQQVETKRDDLHLSPAQDGLSYNFRITAVSAAGNKADPILVTNYQVVGKTQPPSSVAWTAVTPYVLENFGIRLNWVTLAELDLSEYELRTGGTTWETATLVSRLKATSFFTRPNTAGNIKFWLKAIDTSGNYSLAATELTVVIPLPNTTNPTAVISGQDFVLGWTLSTGAFAIDYFDIRHGASFAAGTVVDKTRTIGYSQHIDYGGVRTYWIAAVDVAGNVGPAASVSLNIQNPTTVTITTQVIDNNVLMNWTDSTTSLPIVSYEIRKGASWAAGAVIGDNGNGRFAVFFEQASGVFTYWVRAVDTAGNVSVATSITATVSQPPDYALRLDYNVDFKGLVYDFGVNGDAQGWVPSGATQVASTQVLKVTSTGIDPILARTMNSFILRGCEYQMIEVAVRRVAGAGWEGNIYYSTAGHGTTAGYYKTSADTSPAIGESKIIRFDMNALTVGGQDWNTSIIESIRIDLGATSADIFEIDSITLIPYLGLNIALDNGILYATLKDESWQTHFTSNAWTTPQNQIDAGLPYYAGSQAPASYFEEILDYGTLLNSTSVTATLSSQMVRGTATVVPSISYKTAWADAWTTVVGVTSIVASNFRYVKIRYDFTGSGNSLISLLNSNLKISSKTKYDGGTQAALSTDTGGTVVTFNTSFIDIQSITVTGQGTTPITAIYDFVDVPNPTSFKVLLFNNAGARVSGAFSWTAKGV